MNFDIVSVRKEQKEILRNLLEKYDYEFSQWTKEDVNELGLFGYDYFDCYWTKTNRFAYFIYVEGKIAGFVMVNDYPEDESRETDFTIAEFCILYKYRKQGIGKQVAFQIFDLHKGKWQLKCHPHNIPSVCFWNKVIAEYTKGDFELIENHPDVNYDDGVSANVFYFNNK